MKKVRCVWQGPCNCGCTINPCLYSNYKEHARSWESTSQSSPSKYSSDTQFLCTPPLVRRDKSSPSELFTHDCAVSGWPGVQSSFQKSSQNYTKMSDLRNPKTWQVLQKRAGQSAPVPWDLLTAKKKAGSPSHDSRRRRHVMTISPRSLCYRPPSTGHWESAKTQVSLYHQCKPRTTCCGHEQVKSKSSHSTIYMIYYNYKNSFLSENSILLAPKYLHYKRILKKY